MKKILFFIISLFILNNTYALSPVDFLNKTPASFSPECYEYYNKIDKSTVWSKSSDYQTYKINLNNIYDLAVVQNWYILPYKFYSDRASDLYNFQDNLWINSRSLYDYNYSTFTEINSKTQNEIILSFKEEVQRNNFSIIFNYESNNFSPEFYISSDRVNWNKIKKEDIEDFNFKYLKINFVSNYKETFLENIKIHELSFYKKSNTILIKSFFDEDINIYSKNNCLDKNFYVYNFYDDFWISKDTKVVNINIGKNPIYNVYTKKDIDKDWVEDEIDNCMNIYNSSQMDSNSDWIWDECSDNDSDGIIWNKDNCINIYNPDQKDVNRNKVWDVCEFDKDKDLVFDELDNCITKSNPDQLDYDKDNIWDVCDNCKFYNPNQLDANSNSIWDLCEEVEKNLVENDEDKDRIIDNIDNCKTINNPDQLDYDKDSIWDVCDNCMDVVNTDQIDFDKNKVWDMCEDSDKDWIVWYQDNCLNVKNEDQLDSDNDWIWNLCEDDDFDNIIYNSDNCPNAYNPDQIDIDEDWIGDQCDEKDDRYIESNSTFFIWLLIFISILFWIGIYLLVKKLK